MRTLNRLAALAALALPTLVGCGSGSPTAAPKGDGGYEQKMRQQQGKSGDYEQMMKQKMGGAQPTAAK